MGLWRPPTRSERRWQTTEGVKVMKSLVAVCTWLSTIVSTLVLLRAWISEEADGWLASSLIVLILTTGRIALRRD